MKSINVEYLSIEIYFVCYLINNKKNIDIISLKYQISFLTKSYQLIHAFKNKNLINKNYILSK